MSFERERSLWRLHTSGRALERTMSLDGSVGPLQTTSGLAPQCLRLALSDAWAGAVGPLQTTRGETKN